MKDPRFAKLKNDPRFKKPRGAKNKVILDERFANVLGDNGVQSSGNVDKYGRRIPSNKEVENLKRFYRLRDEDSSSVPDFARGEGLLESSDEDLEADSKLDSQITFGADSSSNVSVRNEQLINLDEASDSETPSIQPTARIAIVNMDWDHIKAVDLFKVFDSITGTTSSPDSRLNSVRIYQSDFGRERMAQEERDGPPTSVFATVSKVDGVSDDERDVEVDPESNEDAIRAYQLERLRYFYAVAQFDSAKSACRAFEELDGTELEWSANVFDLSYVPDDMKFEADCRDACFGDDNSRDYKGVSFSTNALRHSKVSLTWDEDDVERANFTRRAFSDKDMNTADLRAYLASSDSGSELEGSSPDRLRRLLLGDGASTADVWDSKGEKAFDMEVTFKPAVHETNAERGDLGDTMTSLQAYQSRTKEKKERRKAESKARRAEDNFGLKRDSFLSQPREKVPSLDNVEQSVSPQSDSLQNHVSPAKRQSLVSRVGHSETTSRDADLELPSEFQVNLQDERFKAMHHDHSYAVDPSNPRFKRKEAHITRSRKSAKKRRRVEHS